MADYRTIAARSARRYGLDPNIFKRQIGAESGFNPNAISPAGAIGIAQIMPGTASGWGVNPRNPRAALDAAAKHMAQYVKQYGSYRNALVAYNAGPGRVGKSLPAETQAYIQKILGGYDPKGLATKATPVGTTYGRSVTTPGVDNSQARGRLLMSYLQGGQGNIANVFTQLAETRDTPASTKVVYGKTSVGATPTAGGNFAKSHSPLKELFWQGAGGIDAKNGAKVPQGFVSGHQDHVHLAAGPKTVVELGHIAQQKFGLHVGENPHFGGVHPVHATHSYHYKGEAIDVSGSPAKMRAFAHYVARLYGIK